jgi:DNA replication protein DnaC
MRDRDLRPAGERTMVRIGRILAARGADPAALLTQERADEPPLTAMDAAQARIPARYQGALADHPKIAAWTRAIAAAGRPGPGGAPGIARGGSLLIVGTTGTGKTHQAYGAVRSLLRAGVRLRWHATTEADMYAVLRPRPGADTERELMAIARSPLLLLDDLGTAKASEWTEEILYRVVNHRYNEVLPTLITSNLAISDLRANLGDPVASRLAEMTERVVLEGPDRRRRAA